MEVSEPASTSRGFWLSGMMVILFADEKLWTTYSIACRCAEQF